jgi:alkylation response protein AidB-like acyl-CoA dehydrogenase
LNNGWTVANTTLHYERSGMGAGGGGPQGGGFSASPGTVVGHLGRRVGDFVRRPRPLAQAPAEPTAGRTSPADAYIKLAQSFGKDKDPVIRQGLARLHTLRELSRMNTERHRATLASGSDIRGIANFSKLLMADSIRLTRDLGMEIVGTRGTLHAYRDEDRETVIEQAGGDAAAAVTAQALGAQALPIFGGTDQIQRNIIGERALGLPKEPGDLSGVPFNQLPKNG